MADDAGPRRQHRSAVLLILTAVVAMAVGMIATIFVKSPQQVAAETAPPPRTLLKVPLEKRLVTQSVVVNGIVLPENSTVIRLAIGAGTAQEVVGDLPVHKGSGVRAGDRIATVSGRPILVLPGRVPAYRAMKPGITGDDVAQLQQGLKAAGHTINERAGTYGPQTRAAVHAAYAKAGFPALEEGGDAVKSAEESVKQLRRQRDDSRLALSRIQRDQRGSQQPAPASSDAVADAQRTLSRIEEDHEKALAQLAEARDRHGPTVPLGEIVFVPELPATVSELQAAVGQPASASQLTVASGPLAVRAELNAAQATQVRADQKASIIGSDASRFNATTGPVVSDVASSVGNGAAGSQASQSGDTEKYRVTLKPEGPLPSQLENQPTRVSIGVASTPQEVLAAPSAAISTAADGSAQIVLATDPPKPVPVGVGFVGDGFVEITPTPGATVHAGAELIVGWSGDARPASEQTPR